MLIRWRLAACGFFALCLVGCVSIDKGTSSSVPLSYVAEPNAGRIAGAGKVSVTVNDLRANRNRVGSETGSITQAGNAVITTDASVSEVVRGAIETELEDRGFTIGKGPAIVMIDISEFDLHRTFDRSTSMFPAESLHSHAEVLLHFEIMGAAHKPLYSRLVLGEADSGKFNDQEILDDALANAVQNLFTDAGFTNSLLRAERIH